MSYKREETIAAICTAPGEGGVAVIRISGSQAVSVANQVFSGDVSSYATHTVHWGRLLDDGEIIDDGLAIPMLGRRAYTGEDTVELQCHGGPLISRRVLKATLRAGARAAQPGEFTFRAFMNGRLDLAQAEAVQEVIAAKSEHAANAATDQLQGKLSQTVRGFQSELVEIAAILEAWVDFPEEGLEFTTMEALIADLADVRDQMAALNATFEDGRLLQEGIALCLAGPPNAGKSSLMNALLDRERAIVTHIAGTTRDLLEDEMRLGGFHLRLIDTAGIRETDELIEQEGIRRSHQAMAAADLVLYLHDATTPYTASPPPNSLCVVNKIDLVESPSAIDHPHVVTISAKTGAGLDQLKSKIEELIWANGPPKRGEAVITSLRHREALQFAIEALEKTLTGLQSDISPEFICLDLRDALQSLGRIIGTDITEDILSAIFSRFCIGK